MSNQHQTLSALFADIASAIREKTGTASTISADNFPAAIRAISTGGNAVYAAMQEGGKAEALKTLAQGGGNATSAGNVFTMKAICYEPSTDYWYGVGNDAAGALYHCYGQTNGAWYAYAARGGAGLKAVGIYADASYVHVAFGADSIENVIYETSTAADFRDETKWVSTVSNADCHFRAAFKVNDTYGCFVGGKNDGTAAAMSVILNGSATVPRTYTDCPADLVSGAGFGGGVYAISEDGHLMFWDTPRSTVPTTTSLGVQGTFQRMGVLGEYLCAAYTTSDGTFLLCSKSGDLVNDAATVKLTADVLTVVGMGNANGLSVVTGLDASGSVKTWASDSPTSTGVYGAEVNFETGHIPRAIASGGDYIGFATDNGARAFRKAIATVTV